MSDRVLVSKFSLSTSSVRLIQSPTAGVRSKSLFWSTFRIDNFFMEPIETGISSRKFFERLKISKFVSWYKFSGRFSIKFEQRSTHVSDFKWPKDIGKWVSSFLSSISSLSDVKLPKSSGRWVIWLSLIHSKMIHWQFQCSEKIRFTENCDFLKISTTRKVWLFKTRDIFKLLFIAVFIHRLWIIAEVEIFEWFLRGQDEQDFQGHKLSQVNW